MARKLKFTEAVRKRVTSLHKSGRTIPEIRATLTREGIAPPPSQGWISGFLKEAPTPKGKAAPVAKGRPAAQAPAGGPEDGSPTYTAPEHAPFPPAAAAELPPGDLPALAAEIDKLEARAADGSPIDDVRAHLRGLLAVLGTLVTAEQKGGPVCEACGQGGSNIDGANKLTRSLTQLAGTILKLTPPVPADPEAHPDMIAAAQRARDMLGNLVDRALATESAS